jgi:hemoglobin
MPTLYERLGGEAAVQAAVVGMYERIMADAELAGFFAGLDMEAQIKKQVAFMMVAFGGPDQYSGRQLRVAHAPLIKRGLTDRHFDAVAAHLAATLTELGVDAETSSEVLSLVGGTRASVLGR